MTTSDAFVSRHPGRAAIRALGRLAAYLSHAKFTVGAIVCVVDGRPGRRRVVLVSSRTRERGRWGLPGGFAQADEALHVTASRELQEETGLDTEVRPGHLVGLYRQPWSRHIDALFRVTALGEPIQKRRLEVVGVDWFDIDALPPLTRETALALHHLQWPAAAASATPWRPNDDQSTFSVRRLSVDRGLEVSGELDFATAPRLLDAVKLLTSNASGDLTVDIGSLSFIDAGGVNALVSVHNSQRAAQRRLIILGASARLYRVFAIAGTGHLLAPPGPAR